MSPSRWSGDCGGDVVPKALDHAELGQHIRMEFADVAVSVGRRVELRLLVRRIERPHPNGPNPADALDPLLRSGDLVPLVRPGELAAHGLGEDRKILTGDGE